MLSQSYVTIPITISTAQSSTGNQVNFRDGCVMTLTVSYMGGVTESPSTGYLNKSSAAIGESISLTIYSGSVYNWHTASWYLGTYQWHQEVPSGGTLTGYIIPESWAGAITGSSATGRVTLTTYNSSGTYIGSNSYTFTVTLPTSTAPTIGSFYGNRVDGEVPSAWGVYVQGKSRIQLVISGASGSAGSSISTYRFSGGGYTWSSSTDYLYMGYMYSASNLRLSCEHPVFCCKNGAIQQYAGMPGAHASATTEFGVGSVTNYGHVKASAATPLVAGTAKAGTDNGLYAREGHVHPVQTTVSGNAGTATKLATARSISLSGDATGSASFDGSANAAIAAILANSGVTAGAYGPTANATAAFGGTISIPQVTVDAKGRVTAAAARTITLPANPNVNTMVTNTLNTATKAYVTGTTTATTSTGTQVFDTGVYLDTTAGHLTATQFNGKLSGSATSADTATKLTTARNIALTGDVTGTASFNGTANASIVATLASSGATAGSYGPTANASPAAGGTIAVPQVTVDAKGRITAAAARTITLPTAATTATQLATARTVALTGAVTGSGSFNGSANLSIATTLAAHTHSDYLPMYTGTTSPTGTTRYNCNGYLYATRVYGAVWNDYAEYRACDEPVKPGMVVTECTDADKVCLNSKRLAKNAMLVSDTFGFAIGQSSASDVPIAVSGRVLAYTDKPRSAFKAGDVVCAGKNGTVSKMRKWETILYPDRILGIVSHVPDYDTWNGIPVDGRIWIKVR